MQERNLTANGVVLATVPHAAAGPSRLIPHSTSRSGLATAADYDGLPLITPDSDFIAMEEGGGNDPGQLSLAPPCPEWREAEGPPDGMPGL